MEIARNLSAAHRLLEKLDFDVIVADLQVASGPNGTGLGDWLARHRPALSRKLVWMSAVAPSGGVAGKLRGIPSQVLQKPFKVNDLLAAVDVLLNRMDAAPIGR